MERVLSEEDKIRRAIEISQRRNQYHTYPRTTRVNVNKPKNNRLFKRMILQIIICLLIYSIFYLITTTNYIFSDKVKETTSFVLNYDINFEELYIKASETVKGLFDNTNQTNEAVQQNTTITTEEKSEIENVAKIEETEKKELSQMEKDAQEVKTICKFMVPLKGKITSEFRNKRSSITYHEYES